MPLYKTIPVNTATTVYIWKIEESVQELEKNIELTSRCRSRIDDMRSEIHQKGFLSVRQLLKIAGYKPSDLFYNTSGKPHLTNGYQISITHSFIFSAIIISSENEIGIDIEKEREKIQIIAPRFMRYELNYLKNGNLVKPMSVIWCVKESLYKAFAAKGLSFRQHIKVVPFLGSSENQGVAWIHYGKSVEKYRFSHFSFEGFTCAYALKEKFERPLQQKRNFS
ncbi:4'-phosphopantetheinyl transferase family protein [Ascidiimonas aurantiaca]|uniref:4'-phosphopantetheinyl transferase family protein n=1 Tax=Ascidiimonas aurantiaca TaxID=1685432 RepID=UPI0030EF5884